MKVKTLHKYLIKNLSSLHFRQRDETNQEYHADYNLSLTFSSMS